MHTSFWGGEPGRSGALRLPSPLRTVRDSFPSHGSSTSKVPLVGVPAKQMFGFTIPSECQHSRSLRVHQHKAVICFPLCTDSPCFLVKRHQPEVSLLTEPRMFHSVSLPLQQGFRFLRHLDPDLQQLALRLACPKGEGPGVPRSTFLP